MTTEIYLSLARSITAVETNRPDDAGITWDGIATIIAAVIAAIAIFVGYLIQQVLSRKERRAAIYGEALRAVEDYLEAPYRIMRKDKSAATRTNLVAHVNDIQSRISYYSVLLSIYAPTRISEAYNRLVIAARAEAGAQMTSAWSAEPLTRGSQVPLVRGFDRTLVDLEKAKILKLMRLRRFK